MSGSAEDLYAVLGATRQATSAELKRLYRQLALKHHPDKNPGDPCAHDVFKRISVAYSVLSDPEKRSYYDDNGTTDDMDVGAEEFMSMFQDLFADFLGGVSVQAMLDCFSPRELARMPPFPFPKELFPPGTFPKGMRFSGSMKGLPPSIERILLGEDSAGLASMINGMCGMPDSKKGRRTQQGRHAMDSGSSSWETASDSSGWETASDEDSDGDSNTSDVATFASGTGQDTTPSLNIGDMAVLSSSTDQVLDCAVANATSNHKMPPSNVEAGVDKDACISACSTGIDEALPEPGMADSDLRAAASSTAGEHLDLATAQHTEAQPALSSSAVLGGAHCTLTATSPLPPPPRAPAPPPAAPCPAASPEVTLVRDWISAARSGDLHAMGNLLSRDPGLLWCRGTGLGHTALHWCAAKGDVTAIRWLLARDTGVNILNAIGATPLHAAARNGQLGAVQLLLLQPGVQAEPRDEDGCTPAQLAQQFGHTDVVQTIAKHLGVAADSGKSGQCTVVAATAADVPHGPAGNGTSQCSAHPVTQSSPMAAALPDASRGALVTPATPPKSGSVPVGTALAAGFCASAAQSKAAATSSPAGSHAQQPRRQQQGAQLLSHGADGAAHSPIGGGGVPPEDGGGRQAGRRVHSPSASTRAACPGPKASGRAAASQIPAPRSSSASGRPASPGAMATSHAAAAAAAVDERAKRRAALLEADRRADCREEQEEAERDQAAEQVAAAHGVGRAEGRDWMEAAKNGAVSDLQQLLGRNPRLLVYQGQGTNNGFTGHTALHWAAAKGHPAAVQWLLSEGAGISARNNGGATALHAAVGNNQASCVRVLLLEGGADPQIPDDDGETPRDVAVRKGLQTLAQQMDLLSRAAALKATPCSEWTNKQMRTLLAHAGVPGIAGLVEKVELTQAVEGCLAAYPPRIVAKQPSRAAVRPEDMKLPPQSRTAGVRRVPTTEPHSSPRKPPSATIPCVPSPQRTSTSDDDHDGGAGTSSGSTTGAAGVTAAVEGAKLKGNAAFAVGDFAKAVSHYSMAIRLSSAPTAVLFSNRAAAFGGLKYWGKSLDDAEHAAELEPRWAKAHARRGAALLAMQQWDEAITAFSTALALEPGYGAAVQGLQDARAGKERQR